jgi:dipeptidase E
MKLLLTSAGLTTERIRQEFIKLLPKVPGECMALVVSLVRNEDEKFFADLNRKQLIDSGLGNCLDFDLAQSSFNPKLLDEVEVVFVCGGNTFEIMNRMRETSLADALIQPVRDERLIYAGSSAGSIIAGPSIAIAGWGSTADSNEIDLKNLKGLSFIEISIYPHFEESLRAEIDQFKNMVSYPVQELTNDMALLVNNDKIEIV